jgi:hypothetical protein
MIDAKATSLELNVAGKDFTITQSPGLLQSKRQEGTTGAAVWQTSVRVAEWLASPSNVLFKHGVLDSSSTVIELGSGIGGLLATLLATRVHEVVATDQQHLLKLLRENVGACAASLSNVTGRASRKHNLERSLVERIRVFSLDWEQDDVPRQLTMSGLGQGADAIIACDCIFNYALIEPLVKTCEDICGLRTDCSNDTAESSPFSTICLIAQQLRQSDVFEQCLAAFMRSFKVWRVPDNLLHVGLREGSGFVVHVGISK